MTAVAKITSSEPETLDRGQLSGRLVLHRVGFAKHFVQAEHSRGHGHGHEARGVWQESKHGSKDSTALSLQAERYTWQKLIESPASSQTLHGFVNRWTITSGLDYAVSSMVKGKMCILGVHGLIPNSQSIYVLRYPRSRWKTSRSLSLLSAQSLVRPAPA